MLRPAGGRRSRLALALVCLAVVTAAALDAQTVDGPTKQSRLQRLEQWTAALEHHQPGQADEALNTFDDWSAREFAEFKITLWATLALVRDPAIRTFLRPPLPNGRPSTQVFYSRGELLQLLAVATRLKALGENHMLRRGAMLHADAVVLGAGTDSRGGSRRSDFFIYRFDDGQGLGQEEALGQWDVARFLLEQVRPDPRDFRPKPAGDDWVRRWYRTLIAYQLSQMHFNVADAERALELFPDDPEILFFEGVLHETLASPAIQEPLRKSEDVRRSARVDAAVGEFNAAERLLRRVVKLSPEFAEARLHLGRVLAEQEQHKEALGELAQLQDAARTVLRALAPRDQAALVMFSHRVALPQALTHDSRAVAAALEAARPGGETSLFDGIYAGLLAGVNDPARTLVLVFSDGVDTASWLSAEQVIETAKRSDVVVYTLSPRDAGSVSFLRDLTDQTGGSSFEVNSLGELSKRFVAVLEEFRHRYLLSYSPKGVQPVGWHRLEVRVKNRRGATVRARPGYTGG